MNPVSAEIRELDGLEDLRALSDLLAAVWGRGGESVGPDLLKALAHSGSYIAGAYQDGRLIGGLVGWLGGHPRRELHLHSHILGVLPGSDARGIGFELKQHQRRWCLDREVRVMEWTTDPLVRRNAYFNLTKLGARAPDYLVNFYGAMADDLNAGEESDRLLVRWQLDSPEAQRAATGQAVEPDVEHLRERGSAAILSVGASGEPVVEPSTARVLLCQVPEDVVALRASDPSLAHDWRVALRGAMTRSLGSGYAIKGATRSGWYVLEKQ